MFTRRVRIQITLFVIVALVGVSYLSVRYIGLLQAFGVSGYTVKVDLPSGGGLFTNGEVTYRGVTVGRVGPMHLTANGIQVDLNIEASAPKIPANSTAVVADRSVIGEQYLDLRPASAGAPYLAAGSVIAQDRTSLPPRTDELLASTNSLLQSVPIGSLQTVVDELDKAFQGSSQSLQMLLDSSGAFFTAADQNFPQTAALIDTSTTVLATQKAESDSIISFSNNLNLISAQLKNSDGDLRSLIESAPAAAQQITGLINDVGGSLGVLLGNLLTTSQVFLANVSGVQELLVKLPSAIDVGSSVFTPQGLNTGLAVTFFDPLPCTSGYRGTVRRSATDVSAGQPLNTTAGCTASASDGSEVRGSANAPGAGPVTQSWFSTFASSAATSAPGESGVSSLAGLMGAGS